MADIDVRATLGGFAGALMAKDWDRVESYLTDDTFWSVAGDSALAGQATGPAAIRSLLEQVVAKAFDRPGAKTEEAEILVGEHHHGIFWFFTVEDGGAKRISYEIWLVELTDAAKLGAVFVFSEATEMQRAFWA